MITLEENQQRLEGIGKLKYNWGRTAPPLTLTLRFCAFWAICAAAGILRLETPAAIGLYLALS